MEYVTTVRWERREALFTDNRYSRAHTWEFDGGATVPASSSPHVVPLPYSEASHVDPEEAFVAALASCHMLFFLSHAARGGFVVDRYTDRAAGVMTQHEAGKQWIGTVTLRPHTRFAGPRVPDQAIVQALHHQAHEDCFIANSVKTTILCLPSWEFCSS